MAEQDLLFFANASSMPCKDQGIAPPGIEPGLSSYKDAALTSELWGLIEMSIINGAAFVKS